MATAPERAFLVKIEGIDGLFAELSGGEVEAEATEAYNGGDLLPEILTGPPRPQTITVRRPWDPVRDAPILARLRPLTGSFKTTVSQTPTDATLAPRAKPTIFEAILTRVAGPPANASSGDAARLELQFRPSRVTG